MVLKKLKNKSYVWQAVDEVSHEEQIGSSNLKFNHENDWESITLSKRLTSIICLNWN